MKTNTLYKLNKNLDLKNENFLVKKGTLVTVSQKYNEIDQTIPTVISLKFGNIIGEYQFEEQELKKHSDNNFFKLYSSAKFSVGNCIIDVDDPEKKGKIERVNGYDPASQQWLYGVNYSGELLLMSENKLILTTC